MTFTKWMENTAFLKLNALLIISLTLISSLALAHVPLRSIQFFKPNLVPIAVKPISMQA